MTAIKRIIIECDAVPETDAEYLKRRERLARLGYGYNKIEMERYRAGISWAIDVVREAQNNHAQSMGIFDALGGVIDNLKAEIDAN